MLHVKKRNRQIIDIHSHILPGIDDGSKDMETSIEMLRIAANDGVTDIFATPHFKDGHRNASVDTIMRLADELRNRAKSEGIDINIHLGNEIFYFSDVADYLDDGRILTLGNSDYVLVEFSPGDNFSHIRGGLDELRYMGYMPVLAHVERYECMVRDINNVKELHNMGVKMQVNAASITGDIGSKVKHAVIKMIDKGYVYYIGTDAHDVKKRVPVMSKAIKLLDRRYEMESVDYLICNNALEFIE